MPKEMVRVFERDENNPNGKSKISSKVKTPVIDLNHLRHQLWAKNGESIQVPDLGLILHEETMLHAAKRIWQEAKPRDFDLNDRNAMLIALEKAVRARHGQYMFDHTYMKFDATKSIPDFETLQLRKMKSTPTTVVLVWNSIITQTTPTQENPTMSKTMYDTHIDKDGNGTPIFMLEDDHLERIISGKAKHFANLRAKMSEDISNSDPMVAAMGRTQKWSPEQLQTSTRAILNELNPYLQEALVRNTGSLTAAAGEAMFLIAKRGAKIEKPAEIQLIEVDETEAF